MLVYIVPVMVLASAAKQNTNLHGANFLSGEHVIDRDTCCFNFVLIILSGGSVGSVPAHVSLVSGGGSR